MSLQGLGISGVDEPCEAPTVTPSTSTERQASRAATAADERARAVANLPAVALRRAMFAPSVSSESDDWSKGGHGLSHSSSVRSDDNEELIFPPDDNWVAPEEDEQQSVSEHTSDEDDMDEYDSDEDDGDESYESNSVDNPTSEELQRGLQEAGLIDLVYADVMMRLNETIQGQGQEENTDESRAVVTTGIRPTSTDIINALRFRADSVSRVIEAIKKRRRHARLEAEKELEVEKDRQLMEKDFFASLVRYPDVMRALVLALPIDDFVSLYSISKGFNESINGFLPFIMSTYAAFHAPETSSVFDSSLYNSLCRIDPVGRPDPIYPGLVRLVPSFPWLRMVLHRHKTVRDILALMAREGFRMPKTTSLTLKKTWLTMDCPTNTGRSTLVNNETYWTNSDLLNLQMFITKLDMRLNDPIDGPGDDGLRKLMFGQRGLTPLCKLLKRTQYTDVMEIIEASVRYCYVRNPAFGTLPIFGVPFIEIGIGHLEGWGKGFTHLYRMDELVMREAVKRNLGFLNLLTYMMCWGYVDAKTGKNIEVTKEEMYMSNEEESSGDSSDENDSSDEDDSSDDDDSLDEEGALDEQMEEEVGDEGVEEYGGEDIEEYDGEYGDEDEGGYGEDGEEDGKEEMYQEDVEMMDAEPDAYDGSDGDETVAW